MAELTRRGFLGACLAMAAAPAIVRADSMMRIMNPTQGLILPLAMTGAVREIRMYDVRRDSYLTRWDVAGDAHGAQVQIHVCMEESNSAGEAYVSDPAKGAVMALQFSGLVGPFNGPKFEQHRRDLALIALRKEIDRTGMSIVHGRLDLPAGVEHARFIDG